jgi:hypothetical protein
MRVFATLGEMRTSVKRSRITLRFIKRIAVPDYTALHPGYGCRRVT